MNGSRDGRSPGLEFDGSTLFWYDDKGNLQDLFNGISGPWGRDELENGSYNVSNFRKRTENSMKCNDAFGKDSGFSVDLTPKFETTRTDLRIHPDGGVAGTLGCIGIYCSDSNRLKKRFEDFFKDDPKAKLPLEVKHE